MSKRRRIGAVAIAGILIIAMVIGLWPTDALKAADIISDYRTDTKYTESLGDNVSTEYAGRIWTDKSVYTNDRVTYDVYTLEGESQKTTTITKNAEEGEDFLIAFSALGSSQAVSGQTQAPVDVVFVIDTSGSMADEMSSTDDTQRIANTIDALNDSIDKVMEMNDYTRVSVVAFSNTAEVLLPLGRYAKGTRSYTTGPWWDEETVTVNDYFSLQDSTVYSHVIPENSFSQSNDNRSVTGGTNIQMGIYTGMNVLAQAQTTVQIEGSTINRVPSLILLSDGAPTYSSSDSDWWEPANNNNDGPGGSPYAGNGMKALMTGAYMKEIVDAHYNMNTTVYTVGMGISGLVNYERNRYGQQIYTGEQDLAYITLDPNTYWTENNNMANAIETAWNTYTTNNGRPSIAVNSGDNYTFSHPSSNDIDDIDNADASKNPLRSFVDDYYDADSASAVTDVFDEIVSNISISAPQVPTELKGSDPVTDGYITYTDPLGQYMEVKDLKAIIYAGQTFTQKSKSVSGNTTTYTFAGEVHSPVYGEQNIDDIIIQVTKDTEGNETLVVKVPASVIPVRVNYIELDDRGVVTSHTNNGAYPIRVLYSVGLQEGIVENDVVNTSKLTQKYINDNTNEDGTINFYSNLFTGENQATVLDDGEEVVKSAGNATVEFEPAHTNPFYYIAEDMPIYKRETCTDADRLTTAEGIDETKTYYYSNDYYHGTSIEREIVPRTGAQLNKTDIINIGGYLYRAKGSPRLNRILEFEGTKIDNNTKTAEDFYAPTFQYAAGSTDPYAGKYVIYLGNNGVLSIAASGTLEITKEVEAAANLEPAIKEFTFEVNFNGNDQLEGTFPYDIEDAEGTISNSGTIADGGTLTLKDGEKAVIRNLPPKTTYVVTEKEANTLGFATVATGDEGEIAVGTVSRAQFVNTYTAKSVTVQASEGFRGTKTLDGRDWYATDSFTFVLESRRFNTPMPTGSKNIGTSHKAKEVTLTGLTTAEDIAVAFDFGSITYTEPGDYEYVISEKLPESEYTPGISYSGAMYTVLVEVDDNGEGQLVATLTMTQIVDDAGQDVAVLLDDERIAPTAAFVNTFDAENVTWMPVGTKDYVDLSGQNPIQTGMFKFALEAVTAGAPMPANTENGVSIVTNVDVAIAYTAIEFTKEDAGNDKANAEEYVYKLTEVNEGKTGYTYDTNEYLVTVQVYLEDGKVVVNPIYPANTQAFPEGNPTRVVFFNKYQPIATTATVTGTKTLVGRDMNLAAGEQFTFYLEAVNDLAQEVLPETSTTSVSNGTDGNPVAFAFDAITFTQPGTYTFKITEENAGETIDGVTYSDHVANVSITVTDNNGQLVAATPVYENGNAFENTYVPVFSGPAVSLTGKKELTGRTLRTGEFFFSVTPENNAPMGTGRAFVSTAGNGTIQLLSNVTYEQAGTYVYRIKEVIPSTAVNNQLNGVTYDTTEYVYTVIVEDKLNGKLEVTSKTLQEVGVTGTASEVLFQNEYHATSVARTVPTMNKWLTGYRAKALAADEFQFTMRVSATTLDGTLIPENANMLSDYITLNGQIEDAANGILATVGNKADTDLTDEISIGDINFGEIAFHKTGVYTLTFEEVIPSDANKIAGVTYTTDNLVVVFRVTDNLRGQLEAELVSLHGNYVFTNTYESQEEFNLTIEKEFTGRPNNEWLSTDKFNFEVVILDPDTQAAVDAGEIVFPSDEDGIQKVEIGKDDNGQITSPNITIHKAGTYKFVVREIAGSIPGVNYDGTRHDIVVTATDNSDGTMNIVTNVENNKITFTNVYDEDSTELSGHDNLVIEKILLGREGDTWLDTDIFTFTLAPANEVTEQAVEDGVVVLPRRTLQVSNDNKAHSHFGNIVFHEEGTYSFTVTEEASGLPGVKDDANNVRTITVVVEDNPETAALEITSVAGKDELTFTNVYTADETTLPGATYLKVIKELAGRNWFADDAFKFTLTAYDDVTKAALVPTDASDATTAIVSLPANATGITITNADVKNNAVENAYEKAFGDIIFREAGTYKFQIKEQSGDIDNVTYDTHSIIVTVVVTDNDEGSLVVTEPSYSGSQIFVNTFTPDAVTEVLTGKKVLDGRTLYAGEFRFHVEVAEDSEENTPLPAVRTVTHDAEGNITFAAISYAEAGTYKYTITEIRGNLAGVAYDAGSVEATVEVIYNPTTGKLETEVSYVKNGEGVGFEFINVYHTDSTKPVSISAIKEVTAPTGVTFELKGNDFRFEIEPSAANPDGDPIARGFKYNGTDGIVVLFENAEYTQPGNYVYTVHEVDGNRAGITYDDSVYTIKVTVTDDESVAKLSAAVEIVKTKDDTNTVVDSIVFDNGYDPEAATAVIHGHKTLVGGYKDLEANEFTFELKAVTDGAPMPNGASDGVITVQNSETGLFQFDLITYTAEGEYEYEVREINDGKQGYTYDDSVRKITVSVENDEDEGALKATVDGVVDAQGNAMVTFENSYVPEAAKISLGGTKELTGRPMKAGEFAFTLLDSEGKEISEAKNAEDKSFTFDEVELENAGTYTFTIVEKNTNLGGVTYDTNSYAVEVVVEDKGGYLEATAIRYYMDDAETDVVFNNSYVAGPTSIQIRALKKLEGRTLKAGEFKFVLEDENGNKLYATNAADGAILFEAMEYDEVGTYVYKLSEEKGTLEEVTYDETVYTVTIVVEDDLNGHLKATIADENESLIFTNVYQEQISEIPTGDFTLILPTAIIMLLAAGFIVVSLKKRREAK